MIQGIALRNIVFCLENTGHDFQDILKSISLTKDDLFDTEVTITPIQLGVFLENTVRKLNDHRIGLKIGFQSPFSTLGMLGQIYQSCSNYSDALINMKKHIGLIDSINSYDFEIKPDGIYHYIKIHPEWARLYPVAARQMTEHHIGLSLRSRREFLGREIKPVKIILPFAKEGETDLLESYFSCPLEFDAESLCIVLPTEMLEWKIPTSNPYALEMYEAYINRMKGKRNVWAEHTKQHVFQQLKLTSPSLPHIASLMNISPRNLQRHLKEEGFTFRQLVDEIRLEGARLLLMQPQIQISEVSEILGFDVQNSFNRFLQKHIGKTPKEYRKELLC